MAAQLTLTSGPAARGLQAWMTSARISLPTPLSPVIKHAAFRGRDERGVTENRLHQRAAGDDMRRELLVLVEFERRVLGEAGGVPDGGKQLVEIDRLGQIIHRAVADGADGVADVRVGGDQQDGKLGVFLAGEPERFQAGNARHAHVGNHHADRLRAEHLQRALAGIHGHGLERLAGEKRIQQAALARVVIHDEDAGRGGLWRLQAACVSGP